MPAKCGPTSCTASPRKRCQSSPHTPCAGIALWSGLPTRPLRRNDETNACLPSVLLLLSPVADAAVISNGLLRVEISDDNGALTVTDLRTKQTWRQAWVEDDPACRQRVVAVDEAQRQLMLDCGLAGVRRDGKKAVAPFRLSVKLHATRPDLEGLVYLCRRWPVASGSVSLRLRSRRRGGLQPLSAL